MRRRSLDIGSRRSARLPGVPARGSVGTGADADAADAAAAGPGADAGTDAARVDATEGAPFADAADAGAGADSTGAGEGAASLSAAFAELSILASTSALVIRPSFPVPGIFDGSSPCSSTSRRTAGLRRPVPVAAERPPTWADGAPASAARYTGPAPAPAPLSILASTSWLRAVSPVCFRISASTPASGAGTSSTTLSVSSSIRISSFSTASPSCFRQSSSVASGMDSASTGTFTSTVTALSPWNLSKHDHRVVHAVPPSADPIPLTRSSCATPPGRGPARSRPAPVAGWCAR